MKRNKHEDKLKKAYRKYLKEGYLEYKRQVLDKYG